MVFHNLVETTRQYASDGLEILASAARGESRIETARPTVLFVRGSLAPKWTGRVLTGYISSTLDINVGYLSYNAYGDSPQHTRKILGNQANDVAQQTGREVYLIGHSRGGVNALAVAQVRENIVGGLVTLGSPIQGNRRAVIFDTDLSPRGESIREICGRTLRVPTLCMIAERDLVVPTDCAYWPREQPHIQVETIPGIGHTELLFAPRVYRRVTEFIGEQVRKQNTKE